MKIALFSDTYAPDINGVATSTKILRNALIEKGHDVLIVTSELPSDSDYIDNPNDNILRVPGIEISKLYGYRACKMYSFKGMKEIKQYGIQLIHCQTEFGVGMFSRLVAEFLDIPIIYTYHTMWADYSHYLLPIKSNTMDSMLKKMIQRFSSLSGSKCTELIVPSSKTAQALADYGLNREINIIPTGLELDRFDPKNKNNTRIEKIVNEYDLSDKFVITFLGRIAKEKSIDMIIDAVSKINSKKEFVLMIVGGGPSVEELKTYAASKNIKNIHFTGPKDPVYVPDFYHISDVFVSASLSETQGLTFIEAMATSTPVLARYDKNLEGVINDGCNGFFFYDEITLIEKLNLMIDIDLSVMAKQAYKDAMNHSSLIFGDKILEVYNKALKNKRYTYEVKDFLYTKNNKIDVVFNVEGGEVKVAISEKNIEIYKLKIGLIIDRELFDLLKEEELISISYSMSLTLLSRRDYSEEALKKKLIASGEFEHSQLDKTIEFLKQKNLINDYQYSLDYISKSLRTGNGLNKCIYNLNSIGVKRDIIDSCLLELNKDDEYDSCMVLIEKLINKNKAFSHKMMIKRVSSKLYNKGYTADTIQKALSMYDFVYNRESEIESLQLEFQKAFTKYRRKVSNKELQRKLVDVLLKKGYNYDDINELVGDMEACDD